MVNNIYNRKLFSLHIWSSCIRDNIVRTICPEAFVLPLIRSTGALHCFSSKSSGATKRAKSYKRKKLSPKPKVPSKSTFDQSQKGLHPSAGFIGKTRFDVLSEHMENKLHHLKGGKHTLRNLITLTTEAHDKYIRNHGVVEGTKKWKAIVTYALNLLEGRNPENPGWVSTGKVNKWPTKLVHLLPTYIFISDNIGKKEHETEIKYSFQWINTLLKLNRVCHANSELLDAVASIEASFRLDPKALNSFQAFCRKKFAPTRESITLTDIDFGLFLGPSNGPNGDLKLNSALGEAASLRETPEYYLAVKELCTITGNKDFLSFFEQCSMRMRNAPSLYRDIKLRKLVAIPDKANKSRVIAICDFWTQSILSSIENIIIHITEKLYGNQIAYFSHEEGWKDIMNQPPEVQEQLVSLDATSWTENFPASYQYIVMVSIFGQKLANAWKVLAVDCSWSIPGLKRTIKFNKGQGMGTKASFAIAQLTNLVFIEHQFQELYGLEYGSYYLKKVGDDEVIQDPQLKFVDAYNSIGVPINMSKSKFKTSNGNFIEFVSRNSWNNLDYSVISPSLISKYLRNDFYLPVLYDHIRQRDSQIKSINEVIGYKLNIVKTRSNFDLASWQAQQEKVKKISTLRQVAYDMELLAPNDMVTMSKDELIPFLRNLVLATLAEFVRLTEKQLTDKKGLIQEASVKTLVGEFGQIMGKDEHLYGVKDFFQKVVSQNYTFREVVILWMALPTTSSIERSYVSGTRNITDIPVHDPFIQTETGLHILNPKFLNFFIDLEWKIRNQLQVHKNLQKGPTFHKSRPQSIVETYQFLNKLINLNDKEILDIKTGQYAVSKKVSISLNQELVHGYAVLLKTQDYLNKLDNLKDTEVHLYDECSDLIKSSSSGKSDID
jgi:hypothetical protein